MLADAGFIYGKDAVFWDPMAQTLCVNQVQWLEVDEQKCLKVWEYDYVREVITQPGPKIGRSVSCIYAPLVNENLINTSKQKL